MSGQDGCMRTEEGEGRPCRAQEAVQKGHNSNKKEQAQARVVVSAGYHRWRYNMTNLFPLKPSFISNYNNLNLTHIQFLSKWFSSSPPTTSNSTPIKTSSSVPSSSRTCLRVRTHRRHCAPRVPTVLTRFSSSCRCWRVRPAYPSP